MHSNSNHLVTGPAASISLPQ